MKAVHHSIWLILLSALQPTLLNYIKIFHVKPNLFLIYIVLAAFFCGKRDGAIIGAVFGIMLDLLLGKLVGLHAILYMYFGFLFGLISENILKKPTVLISLLAVLVTSLFTGGIEYLFRSFTVTEIPFTYACINILLPETIYSTVFTILMYLILKKTIKIFSINKRVNE